MQIRPQFQLRTFLWSVLVIAAFLGGRASLSGVIQERERQVAEALDRTVQARNQSIKAQARAMKLQSLIDSGTADPIRRVEGVLSDSTILLRRLFTDEENEVRLHGVIPAPGGGATPFITNFCFQKDVRIVERGKDDRGQFMVDVSIGEKNLSAELLRAGLATCDADNCQNPEFPELEAKARKAGRGIWAP